MRTRLFCFSLEGVEMAAVDWHSLRCDRFLWMTTFARGVRSSHHATPQDLMA